MAKQSYSLEFAKKESLDLIHRIVLSNHCSVHLLPWNNNQLTWYSCQGSSGITSAWVGRVLTVCSSGSVHTLDLCVVLCLVLLVFDSQFHSVPRQIHFLSAWFLEGNEETLQEKCRREKSRHWKLHLEKGWNVRTPSKSPGWVCSAAIELFQATLLELQKTPPTSCTQLT